MRFGIKLLLSALKKLGKETLYTNFIISNEFLEQVKNDINNYSEKDYFMKVDLTDANGTTYAEVERIIYIASKGFYKSKRENNEKQ